MWRRRLGYGLLAFGVLVLVVALVLVILLAFDSGSSGDSSSTPNVESTSGLPRAERPLRESAGDRNFLVGAAVTNEPLRDDPRYRDVLSREYNALTPENAMKWDTIHPAPDRYHFGPADAIVDFADRNGMVVRGHNLVWYRQVPDWVADRQWNRRELERVLRDHIHRVVGHYRGRVVQWDVVNEAIDRDGRLRDNVWLRVIGPEYIALAFRWAHEADPNALLFYNDFDLEFPGPKADAVEALVRDAVQEGVPIDGVGLQAHELTARPPTRENVERALRTYARMGLAVGITELDVGVAVPTDPAKLAAQAGVYDDVLAGCLAVARCRTFVSWGFTDAHSWIPAELPGFGDALPFDGSYRPKPAAEVLRARLARGLN
jgi:endo-1,4-beta-xylanase